MGTSDDVQREVAVRAEALAGESERGPRRRAHPPRAHVARTRRAHAPRASHRGRGQSDEQLRLQRAKVSSA